MPSDQKKQKEQNILISIDEEIGKFQKFLEIEGNDRLFFSGKFGIGKTFFLREFAKAKEDEYFIVHLYPVNYQIRENSLDIVELLKYDILLELFSYEEELVQEILDEYSEGRNFRSFMKKNKRFLAKTAFDLAGELFDFIKLTGKSLSIMSDVYNTWKSYKRKEKLMLEYFLSQQKGELKETDFISQLIWDINNKIEEKTGKKTILILDDLDRLDPDNIFRILNVFSAFFDKENENKFGFSKIIIVGDYENIKKIFHHKYGQDTDFQGYMDKFFSIKPYEYLNTDSVLLKLESFVEETLDLHKATKKLDEFIDLFVKYIFIELIRNNLTNLRELLKSQNYNLTQLISSSIDNASHIKKLTDKFPDYSQLKEFFVKTDKSLYLLFSLFGGKENFLNKLLNLIEFKLNSVIIDDLSDRVSLLKVSKEQIVRILKLYVFLLSNINENRFFDHKGLNYNLDGRIKIEMLYSYKEKTTWEIVRKDLFLKLDQIETNMDLLKISLVMTQQSTSRRYSNENSIEIAFLGVLHKYVKSFLGD